jgi:hypothetical protein
MGGRRRLKHTTLGLAIVLVTAVPLHAEPQEAAPATLLCVADTVEADSAANTVQACIDRAPAFSTVEIPAGNYVLNHQIVISTPITLRTARTDDARSCVSAPEQCAVLIAAPDFADQWGLLVVRQTTAVRLERLVIDGNRAARTGSAAGLSCANGNNTYGFNVNVLECDGCVVEDVVSRNALCGTALGWTGAHATIRRSAFLSNGDAATKSMWSDGLTLLYAPRSTIRENTFENNSDVALIIGFGVDARIDHNTIRQQTQASFAGLMLDSFNSNDRDVRGDFRGAVVADNTIDCGAQRCTFGIQIGPRPWYPTTNILGGEIRDNLVKGAKIGINVDGAGNRDAPTAVFSNRVESPSAGSYFADCPQPIPAEWMNIAPTSFVDRRNEHTSTGSHLSDSCQLFSKLSN